MAGRTHHCIDSPDFCFPYLAGDTESYRSSEKYDGKKRAYFDMADRLREDNIDELAAC